MANLLQALNGGPENGLKKQDSLEGVLSNPPPAPVGRKLPQPTPVTFSTQESDKANQALQMHQPKEFDADAVAKQTIDRWNQDPYNKEALNRVSGTLSKIDANKEALQGAYQHSQAQNDWLQAMDLIGKSLIQYAAARYGAEHNVNLSGIKGPDVDWQGMKEGARKNLAMAMESLHESEQLASGEEKGLLASRTKDVEKAVTTGIHSTDEQNRLELERLRAAQTGAYHKENMQRQAEQFNQANQAKYDLAQSRLDAKPQVDRHLEGEQKGAIQATKLEWQDANKQEKLLDAAAGNLGQFQVAVTDTKADKERKAKNFEDFIGKFNAENPGTLGPVYDTVKTWFGLGPSAQVLNQDKTVENLKLARDAIKKKKQSLNDKLVNIPAAQSREELHKVLGRVPSPPTTEQVPAQKSAQEVPRRIKVLSPDGVSGTVSEEELPEYLGKGFKLNQ